MYITNTWGQDCPKLYDGSLRHLGWVGGGGGIEGDNEKKVQKKTPPQLIVEEGVFRVNNEGGDAKRGPSKGWEGASRG